MYFRHLFKNKPKEEECRGIGEAEAKNINNPVGIEKKRILKEGRDALKTRIVDTENAA